MTESKYIVKALSVGGKGNKIFKSGDIVTSNCFTASIEDLVKQGFLECIEKKKDAVSENSFDVNIEETVPSYDEISAKEIKVLLKEKGIKFSDNLGKKALYNLLK